MKHVPSRLSAEGVLPLGIRRPWTLAVLSAGQRASLLLLLFGAVWLAHLSYTSLSPPADNIEQLTWVTSIEGGYYKHPPLPTWLFWWPVRMFGATAWTSYVVGAACTLGAMALLWRLLSEMRGSRYATIALLADLCVTYYNGRLYYYNHNTVLMVFVTLSAVCCWKAHVTGRLGWWMVLGAALGLGALAKYQIAVTGACVLVFWLHQRGWRDPVQRQGLLLATLIALLILSPHIGWLRTHDFGPINYAIGSSLGAHLDPTIRVGSSLHWFVDQVFNRALPAWILLGATVHLARRRRSNLFGSTARRTPWQRDTGRALLLTWGLVPLLFMPLVGVLFGADLQLQWGTPFLLFAVPAAMELAASRVRWQQISLQPAAWVFVAVQALLMLLSQITSPHGIPSLRDGHWRSFDGAALAQVLERPARAALGGKIEIVSGPAATAGALALALTDKPRVLIDGAADRSPWLSAQEVRRLGALEVGPAGSLPGGAPVGDRFPGLAWRVLKPIRCLAPCGG